MYFLDVDFSENYTKKSILSINDPIIELEELQDVDTATDGVIPARNSSAYQIFFLETSYPEGGFLNITPREACAVESAAKMHPHHNIYLLFVGNITINSALNCTKIVKNVLRDNPNVFLRKLDYVEFSKGTPMEDFFKKNKNFKESKFFKTHLADMLRLITLYKYGGLYFDLDVVVLKNFEELGENFVARAEGPFMMSGTLQFSSKGIGHIFAENCLKDLAKHYRPGIWGAQGPELITRQMKRICGVNSVNDMTVERCKGIKIFERSKFLPVPYTNHKKYFAPKLTARMVKHVEKSSFTAHIFSKMNRHFKLFKGDKAAYLSLAEKYCPVVYNTLDVGDPF
ncbi:lactosylceramide 4-alpha-galactosyltransferase-like [Culicoides brevitarsis]|uniref:lactosylceramide 4-alpha-galactosyltransferase-like n=1 Tax=Culicoides brevitarsis TaxID=469753 RepID=UPI00307B1A0E